MLSIYIDWLIHSFNNESFSSISWLPTMSVVSNNIKDAQKYIFPKWLSVWSNRVKAVNKKLKPKLYMHNRITHRILRELSGKGTWHLEEVKAIPQSTIELFFFFLITFESAFKPNHPRETGFHYYIVTHFFTPNMALNFPLTVSKNQSQGQRFTETVQTSVKSNSTESFQNGFELEKTNEISVLSASQVNKSF